MSVYIPRGSKTWVYDFWLFGKHYRKSTGQTERALAQKIEDDLKGEIRRARAGAPSSPRFVEWAGVFYEYVIKEQQLRRPEAIDDVLRVLLRFCGAKPSGDDPKNPPYDGEPYHDLRLKDFIDDADRILEFEDWMDRRGIAAGTKHQYRTYMSRMYKIAMLPRYRKATGVKENPFAGIPRGKKVSRKATLTVDQLLQVLGAMSYHVRLAVGIAALAPSLRLDNVLTLHWREHFDDGLHWITFHEHKTVGVVGEPKVVPIPEQLRAILLDAKQRKSKRCDFVVQYRGGPVSTITNGFRAACERAGIAYGRFLPGGATYHSIRHSISTLLPQLGVNPWIHRDLMGWKDFGTADGYTHLRPMHLVPAAEQLSAALPIAGLVTDPRRRARGQTGGLAPSAASKQAETPINPRMAGRRPGRPFVRKVL